jgi:hypothetical protein
MRDRIGNRSGIAKEFMVRRLHNRACTFCQLLWCLLIGVVIIGIAFDIKQKNSYNE